MSETKTESTFNRRGFNKALMASAAVAAVPAPALSLAEGPAGPFEIMSAADVAVHVSGGASFSLTVLAADGTELESHNHVTSRSIHRVQSRYFSTKRIQAPQETVHF